MRTRKVQFHGDELTALAVVGCTLKATQILSCGIFEKELALVSDPRLTFCKTHGWFLALAEPPFPPLHSRDGKKREYS